MVLVRDCRAKDSISLLDGSKCYLSSSLFFVSTTMVENDSCLRKVSLVLRFRVWITVQTFSQYQS